MTRGWKVAYWILGAGWMLGAALTMRRVPAGFFSNYLSDLVFPPWFYIVARGLASNDRETPLLLRWFGRSPERTATSIFLVGVVSEVSQHYWPLGPFGGRFDVWDIVAYGAGLSAAYCLDKLSNREMFEQDR